MQGQQPGLIDLDPGFGDPVLDVRPIRQLLTEGHASFRTSDHELERPLGGTDGTHAVVDAARTQPRLTDGEAFALTLEDVLERHEHILEDDLGVALPVGVAVHGKVAHNGDSGGIDRHDEHRLLPVHLGGGIGLAHDDEHAAVRVHSVRCKPLAAVEHETVLGAFHGHFDVRRIGAGHGRLGHREGRSDLSGKQRFEVLLLVLIGAEDREDLHIAGIRSIAVDCFGGDLQAASGDLGQRRIFEVRQAGTPLRVRVEEVPQALLLRFGLEVFEDLRLRVGTGRCSHLFGVDRLGRVDEFVHERVEALLILASAFAGFQHVGSLFLGGSHTAVRSGLRRVSPGGEARCHSALSRAW